MSETGIDKAMEQIQTAREALETANNNLQGGTEADVVDMVHLSHLVSHTDMVKQQVDPDEEDPEALNAVPNTFSNR